MLSPLEDDALYFDELRCNKPLNEVSGSAYREKERNIAKTLIIADSAEPKSIADLKAYGASIRPTEKGAGFRAVQHEMVAIIGENRC